MTPGLRIGDAERERAQAALGDHYAAGRLDHAEYTERLDAIWTARTHADLAPLFADLPGPDAVSAPRAWSTPADRGVPAYRRRRRGVPVPVAVLLVVLAAVVVTAHLPLVLLGLAAWFLLVRGGCASAPGRAPRRG